MAARGLNLGLNRFGAAVKANLSIRQTTINAVDLI